MVIKKIFGEKFDKSDLRVFCFGLLVKRGNDVTWQLKVS